MWLSAISDRFLPFLSHYCLYWQKGPATIWTDAPLLPPRHGPSSTSQSAAIPIASVISIYIDDEFKKKEKTHRNNWEEDNEDNESPIEGSCAEPRSKISTHHMHGGKKSWFRKISFEKISNFIRMTNHNNESDIHIHYYISISRSKIYCFYHFFCHFDICSCRLQF